MIFLQKTEEWGSVAVVRHAVVSAFAGVCCLFAVTASGQEPLASPGAGDPSPVVAITLETIESRAQAAEKDAELDDDSKKRVAELYRQASDHLQRSKGFAEKLAGFIARGDAKQAAQRVRDLSSRSDDEESELNRVRQELQELTESLKNPQFVPLQELNELEQTRVAKAKKLTVLKEEQARLEAESSQRVGRRKELRSRLAAVAKELTELERQAAAPTDPNEKASVGLARSTELVARRAVLAQERPALERELLALDAEDAVDLVREQRDLKTLQVQLASAELQVVEMLEKRKKDIAAREQVSSARDDRERHAKSALLGPLAERNFALSELNQVVTKELAEARDSLSVIKNRLEEVSLEFEDTQRRVDSVGLPASVGVMLRKLRADLPDLRKHRAAVRERQPRIESTHLTFYDLDAEDAQLANKDDALQRHVKEQQLSDPSPADEEEAKSLLARRQEYLDPLVRNQESLFDVLAELSFSEQQLINKTEEFATYIDERVLWIRSGQNLIEEARTQEGRGRVAIGYREAFVRLASPASWLRVGRTIVADARQQPFVYAAAMTCVLLILRMAVPARREIREIGERAEHSAFSQFRPTLKVVALTALVALPWPLLLAFAAWRLGRGGGDDSLSHVLAVGLQLAAIGYLSLDGLRHICRPKGLAESHLEWPAAAVAQLRRGLRWLMFMGLPAIFLTCLVSTTEVAPGKNSLERLLFIACTGLVSVFLARVLHPQSGVFQGHLSLNPSGWASRLRHFWYGTVVASPLLLSALAFLGYYYTAKQLAWKTYLTIGWIAILFIVHSLISRLLLVHRRRLSLEQAKQRRAAAEAAAAQVEVDAENPSPPDETPTIEESLADLRTQTSQTRRLASTALLGVGLVGLWLTWHDVVPALGFLERWPLWESTTQVTSSVVDPSGNVVEQTRDVIDPVTIADLSIAILVVVITVVAARNLPGLLEISVLQQLPLETSVRYAITTLCSYVIVLLGLIISANAIGLHWNQVQWMATALTFGLAFGLQEVFANFVAGIIILFERPIRVGDIVTLGDVSGTVSRVRIRATTITNWDRKDFVVPNKDFITGRVLNWTLSDQVNRIIVKVGIAYGADTRLAKSILLRIAQEHPLVVDDPEPRATFEEFADSSLSIVLRCFIAMRDWPSRLEVIDALHSAVDEEFKTAGIEIAFPQRDLHIRTLVPPVQVGPFAPGRVRGDSE